MILINARKFHCVIIVLYLFVIARAQVVSYEATSTFPEEDGWVRSPRLHLPDRWVEDGWFVEQAELFDPAPPVIPEDDFYRRGFADFAGQPHFALEWVVETNGPREAIPGVSPASLVAGGMRGILFHFTIARDRVRYIGTDLLERFYDIAPGVPHRYRLEIKNFRNFTFTIDDQIVYSGISPGPYPTEDSQMVFGVRAGRGLETTRWDYIRFGVPPLSTQGDCDCSGRVDFDDIDPFILAVVSRETYAAVYPACDRLLADMSSDGEVDFDDIDGFVGCLLAGGCAVD